MYRIGFMPMGNMLQWEPEAICAYVREAGYQAIEIQAPLIETGSRSDGDRKKLADAVERNELAISEVVLQRDFVLPDADARAMSIEFVIENMRAVADMGVSTVNLFTGPVPWSADPIRVGHQVSEKQAWDWVFEAFDRIIPIAESLCMRLAVENVWGMLCHDFYSHLYLQHHYDSPFLGVNLDPSHDVLYGHTDMRFLVEGWGLDKIFHIHLKDAVGIAENGKFVFPLLGEGLVDWRGFFDACERIGYQGCMSVEFESWGYIQHTLGGRHEESAALSRKTIEKLMK